MQLPSSESKKNLNKKSARKEVASRAQPSFDVTYSMHVRFEVFTAVTMKNGVFWDVSRVALVRTLTVTSVVPSSPILVTLMKEAPSSSETRFLKEPHGVLSQKTPFFISHASSGPKNKPRGVCWRTVRTTQ
jgi:hypothetical protein